MRTHFEASALFVALLASAPLAAQVAGEYPGTRADARVVQTAPARSSSGSPGPLAASVIVPAAQASTWGNSNNAIPFTTGRTRYQQVFLGSEMPSQMLIRSVSLRRDQQFSGYAGNAAEVEILMGYTTYNQTTLTDTFAKNANSGAQIRVLARRKIRLDDMPSLPPTDPKKFFLTIGFDRPFNWTRQSNRNLLIEIRIHGNSNADRSFWYQFDAASNTTTARLFARGDVQRKTGIVVAGQGLVMRFDDQVVKNAAPGYYDMFGEGCAGTGGEPGHIVPARARESFLAGGGQVALGQLSRRWQQQIDAAQMPRVPTRFVSFAHRQDDMPHNHNGMTVHVTMLFGMTTYDKNTLTSTFKTNANRPQTVVFNGKVSWPAVGGGNRNLYDFRYKIKLNAPYLYTPKKGEHFLIEYRNTTPVSVGNQPRFDNERSVEHAGGSRLIANGNPSATVGTVQKNRCAAIRFGSTSPGATCHLDNAGRPVLGKTFRVKLYNGRAKSPALFVFSASKTAWGAFRLPFDLRPFGAAGCDLLVSYDLPTAVVTDARGGIDVPLAVPNDKTLKGSEFHNQIAVLDKGANTLGLAWSNGATATISDN